MATSLGEAISLQGRNTIAEQIGKMSFQANEAQKARVAKAGEDAGDQAKLQQKEVLDLFKRTGNLHRLVVPKANEVVTEAMNQMMKVRSSGGINASNQYSEIYKNTFAELQKIESQSEYLKGFDNKLTLLDRSKKYFGRGFEEFIPLYQRADRLEQIQELAKANPTLTQGKFFNLNPDGLPSILPVDAIPYQKDLQSAVGKISPVNIENEVQALPGAFGTKLIKGTSVVPTTIAQKQAILAANPALKNTALPSVEEVVDEYLIQYPQTVIQVADRMGLDYEFDADGGLKAETIDAVKNHLIKSSLPYAKTTQQRGFAYPQGKGGSGGAGDVNPEDLIGPGETLKIPYGANNVNYTSESKYAFNGSEPKLDLGQSNKITEAGTGTAIQGDLVGAQLNSIHILPYWNDNGIKRPLQDGDSKNTKAGYHPFIYFKTAARGVWGDIEAYRPQQLISGSAKEWATMAKVQQSMLQQAKQIKK
jgi:hypothetical protein